MIRFVGSCAPAVTAVAMVFGLVAAAPAPAFAQTGVPELRLEFADGRRAPVTTTLDRGYAAVPVGVFERLGWSVGEAEGVLALAGPEGAVLTLLPGTPYFHWNQELLQLSDPPYRDGSGSYVPVQLLADFLPDRFPELYAFEGASLTLRAAAPADWGGAAIDAGDLVLDVATPPSSDERPEAEAEPPTVEPPPTEPPSEDEPVTVAATAGADDVAPPVSTAYEGPYVVVIDPGHGGGDPGAVGRGVREKDVALGIGRIMADLLAREPGIEVYLTRDRDVFVPIWDRGEYATEWKGERPGVFISLHANALPNRRAARGFETYFLSEARTEHERRVAAIENAPLQAGGMDIDPNEEPDLGFILRELRTLDHQHWSALLAEMVQQELGAFHPGPNRGVKQGVLAVLTNALMPSVLVEVGFLTNEDEGPLLAQARFQDEAARAIARAVVRFFDRYPPGTGGAGETR